MRWTSSNVRMWHPSDLARGGRAVPLCPGRSDVDLFRDGESVIDLNAEVAHRALDLLVPQQKLHRPQVARAAVDELSPLFGAMSACQRSSGPDQCWQSIGRPVGHTVA